MADVEVVIKIDEEVYKRIQSLSKGDYFEHDICGNSMRRIANGTQIPKGHGRLIDADKIEYWKNDRPDEIGYHFAPKYIIDHAPTIIEADKSESEENHANSD